MTFMDDYMAGKTDGCTLDDHIYDWHQQIGFPGYYIPLHEYLGMTWEQFRQFWHNNGELPERGAP